MPETGTFLSVDPVESEPPYQYIGGNVVNRVDPSGMSPPYECDYCNFEASGYSEGYSAYVNFAFFLPFTGGYESVYDFATMERASFFFTTNWLFENLKAFLKWEDGHWTFPDFQVGTGVDEVGITGAYTNLDRFKSWRGIVEDYRGRFHGIMAGGNSNWLQLGEGYIHIWGEGERAVTGDGFYTLFGAGVDFPYLPGAVSVTYFETQYIFVPPGVPGGDHEWYTDTGTESGRVGKNEIQRMGQDIFDGNHLPIPFNWPGFKNIADTVGKGANRVYALNALQQTWENHQTYFTRYFRNCDPNRAPIILKE
jgi:hypothetical protein